jgi:hypothetical protein
VRNLKSYGLSLYKIEDLIVRAQRAVQYLLASGEFPPSKKVNSEKYGKFKKLQCVNGSSMGCEKIIVIFIKKQHTSEKWTEACTKSYLTLIKIKYFGIMHKYGSYILNFHCHV